MIRYLIYFLLLNNVMGFLKYNLFYRINKNNTNFTYNEINDNYLVSTDYIF